DDDDQLDRLQLDEVENDAEMQPKEFYFYLDPARPTDEAASPAPLAHGDARQMLSRHTEVLGFDGWQKYKPDDKPPDEKQLVEEQPDEKPPIEQQQPKVEFYLDHAGPGDEAEKPPNDEPGDAVPPGIDASVH
ncbi:hypothetical protein FOZ61_002660, partial [Perkinsus olseni]